MVDKLNNQQALTVKKLQDNSETLRSTDIQTLCSQDSVETIYANTQRQEALEMAGETIASQGVAIKEQLQTNDVSQASDVNVTEEVSRISGGTLAEVMTKITEFLAGKTGDELKNGAENLGAMCEVLASQNEKFAEVMGVLAENPLLVADISDILEKADNAAGKDVFKRGVEENGTDVQKDKISKVSQEELEERRQGNKENCEKQSYTGR